MQSIPNGTDVIIFDDDINNVFDITKGTIKEYKEDIYFRGVYERDIYTIEDEKGNMHKCVHFIPTETFRCFRTYSEYVETMKKKVNKLSIKIESLKLQRYLLLNKIDEYSDNKSLKLKNK